MGDEPDADVIHTPAGEVGRVQPGHGTGGSAGCRGRGRGGCGVRKMTRDVRCLYGRMRGIKDSEQELDRKEE